VAVVGACREGTCGDGVCHKEGGIGSKVAVVRAC